MAGPGGNTIRTYQGQAKSNSIGISGAGTIYTYSLGPLINTHKVATIEAYAVVFDQVNYATSSGWIHYIAPLNTGIAFNVNTFLNAGPPYILRPNLPGTDTPPADDGVLSVNVGGSGPNMAYLSEFKYEPSISGLIVRATEISGLPLHPISWKVNWKITCF